MASKDVDAVTAEMLVNDGVAMTTMPVCPAARPASLLGMYGLCVSKCVLPYRETRDVPATADEVISSNLKQGMF